VGARMVGTMGDSAVGMEESASAVSEALVSDMLASSLWAVGQTLHGTVGNVDSVQECEDLCVGSVQQDVWDVWWATSPSCAMSFLQEEARVRRSAL